MPALAKARRNKYGVRTDKAGVLARTYQGRIYASRLEARYAARLDLAKRIRYPHERVVSWTPQVPVRLVVNDSLIAVYIVDFVVTYADDSQEWVEVKGVETQGWRLKAQLFRALFPERKLVIVKEVR